jgi:hypothetical protein
LQEADRIKLTIPSFGTITYDFVKMLLDELKHRGLQYEVAAQNENQQLTNIPDSNGNRISFLDRDVLLIRKDHQLKVIKKQESNFTANFNGILQGWSAIDVQMDRQVFRMINTHLDPLNPTIRNAQALELMNGPANSILPLIITGDLNAPPNSLAYRIFIDNGFHDVWSEVGKGSGLTCCQGSDLLNTLSTLSRRIDYILYKNGWRPEKAELIGESESDRTNTGLWPSDHAGVWARLENEGE